jgi:hypothetical protein
MNSIEPEVFPKSYQNDFFSKTDYKPIKELKSQWRFYYLEGSMKQIISYFGFWIHSGLQKCLAFALKFCVRRQAKMTSQYRNPKVSGVFFWRGYSSRLCDILVFCCLFKKISSFIEFDEIFDSKIADFKQWGVTWHLLEVA